MHCCCWQLLYSAILHSQADSLCSHACSLHKWLAFYCPFFESPPKWCTYSAVWLLYGWCHMKLLPSRHILSFRHLCGTCVQMMPRSEVWHITCLFVRNNYHCTIIINTHPAHIVGVTKDTKMKVLSAGSPNLSKVVSLKTRVDWNIIFPAQSAVRNPTFQNQQTQELIIAYGNFHLACE